ncbi:MAG: hypothetical protein DMD96_29735 [Candidatus Rokuibacteriota bacterium]|nr:MAG: hypothetical protein DMD96_29735 [Candidatus Rokubacteria bacterium]
MRAHGWVGLGIVGAAELLLVWGESTVAGWFTPIVWTGYVLFVDALVARLTLRSYLTTDRVEGVLVALASVGCWWLFELYNAPRFWRGGVDAVGLWWQYHDLEPNLFLRRVGYDWSFATILPALFLTAAALRATLFAGARVTPWRPSPRTLGLATATGVVSVVLPLAFVSVWLVPLVWVGWALLLEPLNYRRGWPSWLADIGRGDASRLLALLASGAVCGALWEFWNYWAAARWTYTVPYLGGIRIFEMPMLGYLGFLPFALEVYAMYHWLRGRLGQHAAEPVL